MAVELMVLPSAGTNLCMFECLVKLIELKKKNICDANTVSTMEYRQKCYLCH